MRTIFIVAWIILAASGLALLARYQMKPGEKGASLASWPSQAAIAREPGKFNLVLSLHPKCPCSAATAEELNRILAHTASRLQVHVLVYRPATAGAEWAQTPLVAAVEKLPNTTLKDDPDGTQARRFGALTSGDVQLYAPDGRLLFHGGITAGRGHAGENAGEDAILAIINGGKAAVSETPVYGCAIQPESPAEAR